CREQTRTLGGRESNNGPGYTARMALILESVTEASIEGQPEPATLEPAEEPADTDAHVRPVVMLLGSDELTPELAIALRRLGAEVIEQPTGADLSAVVGRLKPDFVVSVPHAVSAAELEGVGD